MEIVQPGKVDRRELCISCERHENMRLQIKHEIPCAIVESQLIVLNIV